MSNRRRIASRLDGVSISLIRRMFEQAPPGAINLGLGEPTFDTAEEIIAVGHEALDERRLPYTYNAGMPELRALIADRTPGDWSAESVCVTVGATGALLGSLLACVDPGDEVLVPDPGFPSYAAIARLAGARVVRYPLPASEQFGFCPDRLESRVSPRTRAVVINSPSNPTGQTISTEHLERVARIAEAEGLVVIADEVYREFYYGEPSPSYAEVSDRGLVVYSLSKTESMTGWRIGWVVGPPELIGPITTVNQYSATCAPTLAQIGALRALAPDAAGRAQRTRRAFARRRRLMLEVIDAELRLPRVEPAGAFFVLVEAAPRGDSLEVAVNLLKQTGVITVPGIGFGEEADRFLRLSFAATEEEIAEGVKRMASFDF